MQLSNRRDTVVWHSASPDRLIENDGSADKIYWPVLRSAGVALSEPVDGWRL